MSCHAPARHQCCKSCLHRRDKDDRDESTSLRPPGLANQRSSVALSGCNLDAQVKQSPSRSGVTSWTAPVISAETHATIPKHGKAVGSSCPLRSCMVKWRKTAGTGSLTVTFSRPCQNYGGCLIVWAEHADASVPDPTRFAYKASESASVSHIWGNDRCTFGRSKP